MLIGVSTCLLDLSIIQKPEIQYWRSSQAEFSLHYAVSFNVFFEILFCISFQSWPLQAFIGTNQTVHFHYFFQISSDFTMSPFLPGTNHIKLFVSLFLLQWVETNPSNIRIFPMDICFYLTSWYYANSFWWMLNTDVCRC